MTALLVISSHFSLPIVAVPDVALTAPDVLCTLLQVAVFVANASKTILP